VPRPSFRRRQYFINKPFQHRYIGVIVAWIVLYSLAIGVWVFESAASEVSALAGNDSELNLLSTLVATLHYRLWPALLLFVGAAALQATLASHRIAGPLYRIKRELQAISAGDYGQTMHLRKHDEFKDFEPVINELSQRLAKQRDEELRFRAELEPRLAALEAALREDDALNEKVQRAMAQLREGLGAASPGKGRIAS
jgi:nitrogen fixation/metabolism regulation signal transduction histidine kinase